MDMKWLKYGLAIPLIVFAVGLVLPGAAGLFFNPEGGFSIGGVHVSVDQDRATISPGETAVFNITVMNDSDFPVMINATIITLSDWETSLDPSFVIIEPHQTVNIYLHVTAPEKAVNGTNTEVTILYVVSFPETGETMNIPATTVRTVVKDEDENTNYLPIVVAASAGIGLAAFFSTDKGRYLGSILVSPLYSRIHGDRVLKNAIREGLFRYIREHPGDSFSEIKRNMKLKNGVLAHHLRTLERERYIKSRKDGLYRRFYLRQQAVPSIILNDSQKMILRYLLRHPGATQSGIALNLGVSRQTVNYHVLAMEEMGAIRIIREGRRAFCHPLIRPASGNFPGKGAAK